MRICMFCGGTASTLEDAWPRWLMKRFPVADTARMDAELGGRHLGNWSTAKPRLLLKRLCHACNNGWMSRLENEVKPVLESILDGELQALDVSAQATLAQWAVKTAMVLEAIDSNRHWFYSEDERQRMCAVRTLPQRTSVWIAKCVDQPNVYSAAKDLGTTSSDDAVHAFAATMAFGSLALQVVTIRTPAAIPTHVAVTYEVREGPWDQLLVKVSPISQEIRVWPPSHGLAGALGLEVLTERLSPATQ
jgi:hypothetical protein